MPETIVAIKSVKQEFQPTSELLQLMDTLRQMVNDCVRIGLNDNISRMKKLGLVAYKQLGYHDIVSYYKLCAISHAARILGNRKKSVKRGLLPRQPFSTKPFIISCYGFKIENSMLKIPLGDIQYFDIPLNNHVKNVVSEPSLKICFFTLTAEVLSICFSKEVAEIECTTIEGVDRNFRNLTVGNTEKVIQYHLSKALDMAENTCSTL